MTPKLKSNDPLQSLLREAMHQAKVQVQTKTVPSKTWKLPDTADLYQAASWKPGREAILVVHVDTNGLKTSLGMFQEQLNSRAHGSRLLPLAPEAQQKLYSESLPRIEVHGDYWLQPKEPVHFQESPEEIQAIKDRFHELLELYS